MSPQYGRARPHLARIIIRIFNESEVALLAAKQKILNVTAFARLIQPQVEQVARRKVGVKTIGMTLLRYLKEKPPEFYFSTIFVKTIWELGSKHGYSMIKVKFNHPHPNQYYVVLAKLAIHEIKVVKLSVSNGVLTMLINQEQSGLALVALRNLLKKKKRRFSSQTS